MICLPIWNELKGFAKTIDTECLVKKFLTDTELIIPSYWIGNRFLEDKRRFISFPCFELKSISLRTTVGESKHRSINMIFLLKGDTSSLNIPNDEVRDNLWELSLTVNEKLEILDDEWFYEC